MSEEQAIRYAAQVFKLQTLIDGGIRLTLDLVSPVSPDVITGLIAAKKPGIILECANIVILIDKQQDNNAIRQGTERKSRWQTAEG